MDDLITMTKENHIKRPPNSFMIWSSEKRHEYSIEKNKCKNKVKINNSEISKILGHEWENLPEYLKLKYKEKADKLKQEHKLLYPNYKYDPKFKHKIKNIPNNIKPKNLIIQSKKINTKLKKLIVQSKKINAKQQNLNTQEIEYIHEDLEINKNTYIYTHIDIDTYDYTNFNIIMEHIFVDKSYINVLADL